MVSCFQSRSTPQRRHSSSSLPSYTSTLLSNEPKVVGEPTLDFTQRLESKLAEFNNSDSVWKRWLFEIASLLVSMLCMCGIVAIYIYASDKPLSGLGKLLTLANVLGKIASAALIVPTTEALGQLKWNWFQTSNAVYDFEIFDKATRGPWGAAMLLYRTKGRSLAAFGALLILLLLAIDSFLQQIVDLPERWTLLKERGTVRRTVRYKPDIPRVFSEGLPSTTYDAELEVVLQEFFYGNGTQPSQFGNVMRSDIPITCPTGNCTWPPYETLGVCSQCADASEYLTYACADGRDDWTLALDGGYRTEDSYSNSSMCGYFLNSASNVTTTTLMSGYKVKSNTSTPGEALIARNLPMLGVFNKRSIFGNDSILFQHIRNPIADVLIVSAADGTAASVYRNETPVAQECVLTWCVKTVASLYTAGAYQEEVTGTHINTTSGSFPWRTTFHKTDYDQGMLIDYTEDINIDFSTYTQGSVTYGTDNSTAYAIMSIFDDIFPAFYTAPDEVTKPALRERTWLSGPAYIRYLSFNPWNAPNNVTAHMERLAAAMTDRMRSAGLTNKETEGDAYNREVYISIRWEWLAFPVSLLVLSLAFLVATISKTSNTATAGVWKTSAIPTLIYGLPKETQTHLNSSSPWRNGVTKKLRVKLSPNMGWRVSGQSFLRSSPILPTRRNQPPPGWI